MNSIFNQNKSKHSNLPRSAKSVARLLHNVYSCAQIYSVRLSLIISVLCNCHKNTFGLDEHLLMATTTCFAAAAAAHRAQSAIREPRLVRIHWRQLKLNLKNGPQTLKIEQWIASALLGLLLLSIVQNSIRSGSTLLLLKQANARVSETEHKIAVTC